MEVTGDAQAPEPGENQALKPCLLRRNRSCEQYGVAASCLEDLRSKGWHETGARPWGAGGRGELEPGEVVGRRAKRDEER